MDNRPTRPKSRKPVVFKDGLGRRARTLDASGTELEVLCLRPELSTAAAEAALRDRVQRLANFRSGAFARVRAVQRLNDAASTLALVSTATPGSRLSELLLASDRLGVPLDGSAAWALLMQLASAMAHLHEHAPDVAHGALAPERIVITPDARVMVIEHVLSGAIETLKWTQAQYWHEQRLATSASGRPLDLRSDVTQLGVVALSVVHGRPLTDDEYPSALADLVEAASVTSVTGGREPMSASLRLWLDRTLQLDDRRSFASAIEASAELHQLLAESDSVVVPLALEAFLARLQGASDRDKQAAAAAATSVMPAEPAASAEPAPAADTLSSSELPAPEPVPVEAPAEEASPVSMPHVPGHIANPALQSLMASADPMPSGDPLPFDARHAVPSLDDGRRSAGWRDKPWSRQAVAAAILTVVCGIGWVAASRLFADDATPPRVEEHAPAAQPQAAAIEPIPPAPAPVPSVQIEAPPLTSPLTAPEAATPPPAAVPTPPPAAPPGWVTVRTAHDLNVLENGALLGTSRGGRLALTPGAHQLEFVNDELGYRSTQTVDVRSGIEAAVEVVLPNGTLSINALPWAEVLVDGRSVGETPIGNLAVSAGTHEVIFRHPELGEQRMTAVVTVTGPTRLTADLRKP